MGPRKPVEILLVEDNDGDVELTRVALNDSKIANNLHVAADGIDALAFLHREAPFDEAPRPDLILLDLNMPRMGGLEVLEKVKQDKELSQIPVVILTTSENEKDILQSYRLSANAYIIKPVDFEQFVSVVREIEEFWFEIVALPFRSLAPPA